MDKRTFTVGILPIDGFALMSYASCVEPLRAANLLAERPAFVIRHYAAAGTESASSCGAVVPADVGLGRTAGLDLVFVVAGGDPMRKPLEPVGGWLRRLHRQGVRLGGVSGGPVFLARAGLMAARRMTLHWEHMAELAEFDPSLLIERSLYVIDRDRVTCAGGTAPLDMMHALIAERLGQPLARQVSDWFMHTDIRASADPQRSGAGERYDIAEPKILAAIEAMENHLADPLTLDQLALVSGIGGRQLNRLFQRELETSVMEFYRRLRLDKARHLLTRTRLGIKDIAEATGFAGQPHFNSVFSREFGTPPMRWRREQRNQSEAP